MECLLPYFNMVTAPRETVGLERMSIRLQRCWIGEVHRHYILTLANLQPLEI